MDHSKEYYLLNRIEYLCYTLHLNIIKLRFYFLKIFHATFILQLEENGYTTPFILRNTPFYIKKRKAVMSFRSFYLSVDAVNVTYYVTIFAVLRFCKTNNSA